MKQRFLRTALMLVLIFCSTVAWAEKKMYARLSGSTLTFYYDENKTDNDYSIGTEEIRDNVVHAIFDVSFADARPTNTSCWFQHYKNLRSVEGMSNLNTSRVVSMEMMFFGCSSLSSIDLSHLDTSNVTNMNWMFSDCSGLTSLDVSHFNTSNVIEMHSMFFGCVSLTSLDVSHFNTDNVTCMASMFSDCSGLTSLDVSHFNTSNVTEFGNMFCGCSSLTNLDLSNFDTSNVIDMGLMFSGCHGLTSLVVNHFNTSNVKDMFGMFDACSSLTSLDLSNFDTSNVTSMRSMFEGCSSLQSVDLSNFDTSNMTNMWGMFYGCSSLTSLNLMSFDFGKVTDISYMFDGCTNLRTIYCKADLSNVESGDYVFAGCTKLVGGNGTSYSFDYTNQTYARPDKEGVPGYFTDEEKVILTPIEDDVDYGEDSSIDENSDLSGTVINNVYYNISSDNGGYDAEEGCLVVNRPMTDEEIEALFGKDLTSKDMKENYTGIVIQVPAGIGSITVNAQTTGGMTLKVKVGEADPIEMELEGIQKIQVPYNVLEPTFVYIYAGTDVAAARSRATSSDTQASLKIYGISVDNKPTTLGDVDGDGEVTTADVNIVSDYIMGKKPAKIILKAADVNEDKKINVADIVSIIKMI